MRTSNSGNDHRRATLMGVSLPSRDGALSQAPCMRKAWRVARDCPRAYEARRHPGSAMRRWFALSSLLAALTSFPLLADDPLPPPQPRPFRDAHLEGLAHRAGAAAFPVSGSSLREIGDPD